MRRLLTIAASFAVAASVLFAPAAHGLRDKDCKDFDSRKEAQRYFNKHGGSKDFNFNRLDEDGDGKVCETYDYD